MDLQLLKVATWVNYLQTSFSSMTEQVWNDRATAPGNVLSVEALPRLMGLQLPGQILFIIIATGISLVFALLSWHFYEQPFLKLKRLFPYQYGTQTSAKLKIA